MASNPDDFKSLVSRIISIEKEIKEKSATILDLKQEKRSLKEKVVDYMEQNGVGPSLAAAGVDAGPGKDPEGPSQSNGTSQDVSESDKAASEFESAFRKDLGASPASITETLKEISDTRQYYGYAGRAY
jgi:hypothetical protein